MTEMWIDIVRPWPWQVCMVAALIETVLIVVTLPRGWRILRDTLHRDGDASRHTVGKMLRAQGVLLGVSALAVAALYGYDLAVSQMEGVLLGEKVTRTGGALAGLQSLVPVLVGLGLWGWLGLLVGRRSRSPSETTSESE